MAVSKSRRVVGVVCLAALCGGVVSWRALPHEFRPGPNHPGWAQHYGALAHSLRNETKAVIVTDDEGGTPPYKVFRAQFALAPLLIEWRQNLDSVDIGRLAEAPLILDASSIESLAAMSEHVTELADLSGVEIEFERVRRTLALARLRKRR